jgi:Tol biopolymer transport system component
MTFGLRPIAVGALCLLVATVAAVLAYKTLWPWPPRHADENLAFLVVGAGAIGLATAQIRASDRRRQAVGAAVVLAAVIPFVAVTVLPGVAQPRSHPIPGGETHVLYAAPDGNWDLYLLPHGDASGLIALTDTDDINERWPLLSPDGSSIVYTSIAPDGSTALHALELEADGSPGSDEAILQGNGKAVSADAWTPDGDLLVQVTEPGESASIERLDVATGALSPFLDDAYSVSFSPDGSTIAYSGKKTVYPRDWDIWVADADGRHAEDVIDGEGFQGSPRWSADGTKLTYTGPSTWGDADVFIAKSDGTGARDLTPESRDVDSTQGWTPDGHVMFLSNRSHSGGTFLYVMNDDGSDVQLALRI